MSSFSLKALKRKFPKKMYICIFIYVYTLCIYVRLSGDILSLYGEVRCLFDVPGQV